MENLFHLAPVLTFLDDLSKHNNKPWFDENRDVYEQARETFEQFITVLIDEFRGSDDLQDLTARECIARIYRDIRFSKDKSPYKTNMWATIAPGGKRMTKLGYHIALQPHGRSLIAGGLWEPDPEQLAKFRQAIDHDAAEFKRITHTKAFVDTFGGISGEKLKTVPKGYDHTHPELELLQHKQVVVMHTYTDAQVAGDDFTDLVISGCQVMKPFVGYLNLIL